MSRPILISQVPSPRLDVASAMRRASQLSGLSQNRIALDLMSALLGRRKMKLPEFFVQGAWKGTADERASYIGAKENARLNRSMTAPNWEDHTSLMSDKYLCGQVLEANGFPVPKTLAAFAVEARFGRLPTLATAKDLAAWLQDASHLPAFAKPVGGSRSLGSVPLIAADVGNLDIGGQVVPVEMLAAEVAQHYRTGWLIQELLQQPPDIEALIGPGVGTVRVVTLWESAGPEVLYAVWRHPSPGTWVDSAIHGSPNVGCALDLQGQVTKAWLGDLLYGHQITHSVVTPELPLVGVRLPQWPDIVSLCREAHRIFPGHALIGWDVAMCRTGPVLSEVNANPLHQSYQRSFQRGFLHKEHLDRLDAARKLMYSRTGTTALKT